MNRVPWKDENDNVSSETTSRLGGEVAEEAAIIVATSGKTVNAKPPTSVSSSSSSWMKSKDPRIVRVSKAFGGKDRHSKVSTLRGLRDRRVRLSVPTAIQLYDLQERLGVDQPSKAVDWLLHAAKDDIDELPPLPVSPETFSLYNHHHHQPFLNLGQRMGQDPTQQGFKTNECEENNKERGETDAVLTHNNHHIGSYGTYHNMEQHSNFQAEYLHHQQLHSLIPYPPQILLCPMTTPAAATTTIQSFFPSSSSVGSAGTMETMDPRQMVSHYQMPSSSSQNISSLYSLLHGNSNSSSSSNRMSSVQFNRANNNTTTTANMSRLFGSESSPSRGSNHQL